MITFDELKERTTPKIIKEMCELAEGFEFVGDAKIYFNNEYVGSLKNIYDNTLAFSTLLLRTVGGWNKDKKDNINYGVLVDFDKILVWRLRQKDESFDFKDYIPFHLTACEMAIWDCLLNIL